MPLNQISTVSSSLFKGIALGTSSGKISFLAIKNHLEVHKEITRLLAEKQDGVKVGTNNNLDDLKKIKELLDIGPMTQEEFDAKKKQLLGL